MFLLVSSLQGTFFLSLLTQSKVYPQKIHVRSFQHVHVSGDAILLSRVFGSQIQRQKIGITDVETLKPHLSTQVSVEENAFFGDFSLGIL